MDNNTNTASAFKWRITNAKYIYITDEGIDNGKYGLPFIYDMSGDTRVYPNGIETSGVPNEGEIKLVASLLGPVEYEEQFTTMLTLMQSDEDGKYLQLLSWDAYYKNLEGCSEGATSVTCKPIDVFFEAVTNSYPCGAQAEVNISNITDETYPDGGVKRTFELTFCFPEGNQGTQGEIGTQGVIGTQGMRGTQGYIGTQGMRGTQGYRGTQGPQGAQGPDGGVYPVGEAPNNIKYNVLGYNSSETPLVSKYSNVYYEAFKKNGDDYFTINGQDETTVVYNRVYTLYLNLNLSGRQTSIPFVYYNNYVKEHASELFPGGDYYYYKSIKEFTTNAYEFNKVESGTTTTTTRIGLATSGDTNTGKFYDYLYNTVRNAMNEDDNTESDYIITIDKFPEKGDATLLYNQQEIIGHVEVPLRARCDIGELASGKPILQVNEFKNIEVFPEDDGEVVVRTTKSGLSENYTEYHQTSNHVEIKTTANSTSTLNIKEDEIALTGAQCSVNSNLMVTGECSINSTATAKVNNVSDVTLGAPIGSVIMWAGSNPPDGWLECNGGKFLLNYNRERREYVSKDSSLQKLYNVIGDTYSTIDREYAIYVNDPVLGDGYIASHSIGGRDIINTGSLANNINNADWFSSNYLDYTISNGGKDITSSCTWQTYANLPNLTQKFPLGAGSTGSTISAGGVTYHTGLGETGGEKEHVLTWQEMKGHSHDGAEGDGYLASGGDRKTGTPIGSGGGTSDAHNNMPQYLALNFIIKYQ